MKLRKTVLVIESDPAMRFALGRVSLGSEVALQFIEPDDWASAEGAFAAVLADDTVLLGIGEKPPLTVLKDRLGCPVIVMTTAGNIRFESFAREAGAISVLQKPFNSGELRKHLGKAIDGGIALLLTGEVLSADPASLSAHTAKVTDFGGRIAGDQVFDELFVELERRQPLDEGLDAFDVVERHLVKRALTACAGNQSQAARFLGITRNTLRKRIHKYGFGSLLSSDGQLPANAEQ